MREPFDTNSGTAIKATKTTIDTTQKNIQQYRKFLKIKTPKFYQQGTMK